MPLRGGSKSIPRKNLRPIAARPLFAWSLEQALSSGCFDKTFVSTDSDEIRRAVLDEFGNSVEVLDRSPETATDTASSESVLLEFQERVDFDVVCLVQATSPLTRAEDFRAAKREFEAGDFNSLVTVVELNRFLWTPDGRPINYDPRNRPRRQDSRGVLVENGAFYFTRAALLRESGCRLGGKVAMHVMDRSTFVEVDEPEDWDLAETQLRRRKRTAAIERLRGGIRALFVDVDGTLTDGGMYHGANGEPQKKFDTRDGMGLELLRARGIRVCILSQESSPAVAARMKKLNIDDYFPGVTDKLELMQRLAVQWRIDLGHVAYIGDDLNDLACLEQAGLSCCPANAVNDVMRTVTYVCERTGGAGAVREVCDLILEGEATHAR